MKTNLKIETPARERRVWMTLGGDFKKRGAALLHQQCWCWGCDIRREIGGSRANLLLEWNFERTPPPQGVLGAMTYAWRGPNGESATLWGFGLCFGDDRGQIFVSRFGFSPRFSPHPPPRAWEPKQILEQFRAPRRAPECLAALEVFERALGWIARYEARVAAELGTDYRAQTLHKWSRPTPPDAMARSWEALAQSCAQQAHLWQREDGKTRPFYSE